MDDNPNPNSTNNLHTVENPQVLIIINFIALVFVYRYFSV